MNLYLGNTSYRQNQIRIVTLVEIVNPLLRIYTQHPWIHLHQKKPFIYTVSYVRSRYNYRRIGTSPYFVCTDPRVLRCHDPSSTHCGAQKEGLLCQAAWLRRLSLSFPSILLLSGYLSNWPLLSPCLRLHMQRWVPFEVHLLLRGNGQFNRHARTDTATMILRAPVIQKFFCLLLLPPRKLICLVVDYHYSILLDLPAWKKWRTDAVEAVDRLMRSTGSGSSGYCTESLFSIGLLEGSNNR